MYGHVSVGKCDENICAYVCACKCLQSRTHHAPFITEHLHTPLPGVQETVVEQTNSSLSYWLSASHSGN